MFTAACMFFNRLMWVPFSCLSCLLFLLLENKTVDVSATYGDKTQLPFMRRKPPQKSSS